jgi:hypothetical protein
VGRRKELFFVFCKEKRVGGVMAGGEGLLLKFIMKSFPDYIFSRR